jgi:hypothetical protein
MISWRNNMPTEEELREIMTQLSTEQEDSYDKLIFEILRIEQAHRYISSGKKRKLEEIEKKVKEFISLEEESS